jgi:hypothetical protein
MKYITYSSQPIKQRLKLFKFFCRMMNRPFSRETLRRLIECKTEFALCENVLVGCREVFY